MDTSILQDLGLTNAEIKIYLALLELGSTKAGKVIQKTGLQNSVVHLTLQKLVEKGFASYIKKGQMKHYQASDPNTIIEFIEKKKERFKEILPQLLAKQKVQEKPQAQVYEGFKGFKTMLAEFISDATKGDEYLVFAFYTNPPEEYQKIYNYYKEYEKERLQKGIVVKLLAPRDLEPMISNRKADIVFVDYPIPLNTSIFKDKIIFTPWENSQTTFMIKSKQLAEEYRRFFYEIWNREKAKNKNKGKKN
jgi:sugar-specific transcriptional regulator TrmB